MQFGVCAGIENAAALKNAGFDYIELSLSTGLSPLQPEADIMPRIEDALASAGISAPAFNGMMPGEIKVVGAEAASIAQQDDYLHAALSRAARIGGKVVVFGSGRSRMVPDGFSQAQAATQITNFLRRAGVIAARHGIDIAIEPLNASECNILNSVTEAVQMAQRVALPSVLVLSDLYHVARDGQSYDETADAGSLLAHVHVARPGDRQAQMPQDTGELARYFRAVYAAGYDKRVSIEGGWSDFHRDLPLALQTLRDAWAAAQSPA